jgi:hypothetical protein
MKENLTFAWLLNGVNAFEVANYFSITKIDNEISYVELLLGKVISVNAAEDILSCIFDHEGSDLMIKQYKDGLLVDIIFLDNFKANLKACWKCTQDGWRAIAGYAQVHKRSELMGNVKIDEEWYLHDSLLDDNDSFAMEEEVKKLLDEFDRLYGNATKPSDKKRESTVSIPKKTLKCECGAEKCNTTHSDWCPKYKKI